MFRKLLNFGLSATDAGRPLHRLRPLITALDTFLYEPDNQTTNGPQIRDAIDQKRWMILVVFALLPCTIMAIWNTGVQTFVYSSAKSSLISDYMNASASFQGYFSFGWTHFGKILSLGLKAFLPILFISYSVGGVCELIFAILRGHEISEGFLVSGILFALILPPSIPYWLVALGVASGIILSKELFGGSGMNILNPALTCRCLLFFAYPTKMAGEIWVGTNSLQIKESLQQINQQLPPFDAITQSSPLAFLNLSPEIKRIHIEAIASNFTDKLSSLALIKERLLQFSPGALLGKLSPQQMQDFVTAPIQTGGLGLSLDHYLSAMRFAKLRFGQEWLSDGNLFFGNIIGSMGETSTLACLLGAFFLIYLGIASWRTMVAMALGGFFCAFLFEWLSKSLGLDAGAWSQAKFMLPAYKHLLLGGFAFGLVFMATDPVSSPCMNLAKWLYGLLIGALVIIIRLINPAYPEGVMLAILFGNVFAPLLDRFSLKQFRRIRLYHARKRV